MHFSLIFRITLNDEKIIVNCENVTISKEKIVAYFGSFAPLFNYTFEAETQEIKTFGNLVENIIRYSGISVEC
jgi:hypothetical protein